QAVRAIDVNCSRAPTADSEAHPQAVRTIDGGRGRRTAKRIRKPSAQLTSTADSGAHPQAVRTIDVDGGQRSASASRFAMADRSRNVRFSKSN
ncbi:MAG TPA: hypothetical protein VIV60_31030, partial [Polyangiaceae bacterium]